MRVVLVFLVLMFMPAVQGAEDYANDIRLGFFDGDDGILGMEDAAGARISATRRLSGRWMVTGTFSRLKASGNEAELNLGTCTGLCFGLSYDVDRTVNDAEHDAYALGVARVWDVAENAEFLFGMSVVRDRAQVNSSTTRYHYDNVTQPVNSTEDFSGVPATSVTQEPRIEAHRAATGWRIDAGVRHAPLRALELHANAAIFERMEESGHGLEVGTNWLMTGRAKAGLSIFIGDELEGWQISGRWKF